MIIVTGGAGFIGSNLVASLNEKGFQDIVVCDHLEREEKRLNIAKHKVEEVIEPEKLLQYLNDHKGKIETILHMGAISSTVEKNLDLITRNNVELPLKLWHWCAENNCRFLYASSAATYGDGTKGFVDDQSLDYLTNLEPLNAYGQSKNQFDIEAVMLAEKGITPPQWAGFKFFNVYGPNEYHKEGQKSVVCQMFKQVKENGKVRLFKSYLDEYADGGQVRDFIYVKDCCDALVWFMKSEKVNGIYNLGTGKARSFNDLAAALFTSMDMGDPIIEYFDMPEEIRPRYQYHTEASLDKLRKSGYDSLFTSLEQGVTDYVRNYLDKEDQYR